MQSLNMPASPDEPPSPSSRWTSALNSRQGRPPAARREAPAALGRRMSTGTLQQQYTTKSTRTKHAAGGPSGKLSRQEDDDGPVRRGHHECNGSQPHSTTTNSSSSVREYSSASAITLGYSYKAASSSSSSRHGRGHHARQISGDSSNGSTDGEQPNGRPGRPSVERRISYNDMKNHLEELREKEQLLLEQKMFQQQQRGFTFPGRRQAAQHAAKQQEEQEHETRPRITAVQLSDLGAVDVQPVLGCVYTAFGGLVATVRQNTPVLVGQVAFERVELLPDQSLKLSRTSTSHDRDESAENATNQLRQELERRCKELTALKLRIVNLMADIEAGSAAQTQQLSLQLGETLALTGAHRKRISDIQELQHVDVDYRRTTKTRFAIMEPHIVALSSFHDEPLVWRPLRHVEEGEDTRVEFVQETVRLPRQLTVRADLLEPEEVDADDQVYGEEEGEEEGEEQGEEENGQDTQHGDKDEDEDEDEEQEDNDGDDDEDDDDGSNISTGLPSPYRHVHSY